MKIMLVNYMPGEARFVIEGIPKVTFCVPLKGKIKQKQVLDELKAKVDDFILIEYEKDQKQVYKDLKIKDLEGTDL